MQSYREDNERWVKAQEEQNQLNVAMLQSLTNIQINMNSGDRTENLEGTKNTARRRKRSPSESSNSEGNASLCWVCNCLEIRLDPVWVFIAPGLSSLA